MYISLSKLQKIVKDMEAWHATVYGVTKSQTWLSDWTTIIIPDVISVLVKSDFMCLWVSVVILVILLIGL